MKLYQYTGLDHVQGIQREGMTQGAIMLPAPNKPGYLCYPNIQWLTDDPDWYAQGWATNRLRGCCDRTAVRFRVCIPKPARKQLYRWPDFARDMLKMSCQHLQSFNEAGGSKDGARWWVFAGKIPPGWLRGLERRPVGFYGQG